MADDEREDPASEAPAVSDAAPRESGAGWRVTLISLRVVRGLVGAAAALAVIVAVGLLPAPRTGVEPLGATVTPEPADLLALCPGSLLRLGDDTGANADQASAVGKTPVLTVAASGSVTRTPLAESDAGSGGTEQAPVALQLAASGSALLAGAQTQDGPVSAGMRGLTAAACTEPTSSSWLVGGSTTVGRTTLLLLANPTEVAATVTIELWGGSGVVSAPGLSGITVPAGGQRVLPLSGFAPDLATPVVHVEARGGRVVASLQTSVTRVLDPGGVELVAAGAAPANQLVIPAVRIFDETGVASSLGIEGYDDLEAVVRIGNPGDTQAHVSVSVTPTTEGGSATSFAIEVPAGQVVENALAAALELGSDPFVDGSYTVRLDSDQPIVAGVRTSTIPAPSSGEGDSLQPGHADLAWAASATVLSGDIGIGIADAPAPVLVVASIDGAAHTLTLSPIDGGDDIPVAVPAGGAVAVPVTRGTGYALRGADGVAAAVSFAATGELAAYPVSAPLAADSALLVRP
ncbi:MAG: DUF5719 family protein [Protaetiibacter sp.]